MEKNDCYVGLELCSSAVKLVAGYILNGQVYVLTTVKEKCTAINDGMIVDQVEVGKVIRNVINTASRNLNMPINEVTLSIPAFNLVCMRESGTTNTIDGNDIIRQVDINNIISQLGKSSISNPELKIVDIVPYEYILDNKEIHFESPVDKISKVLTLRAAVYAINEKVLNTYVNCVSNAGYTVKNTVISQYASSLYLSTLKIIPNNYVLVDIGHSITTVNVIKQHSIVDSSRVYRFGSKTIINKVAERFNIDETVAEELVTTYGIDYNLNFNAYVHENISFDDLSDCICSTLLTLNESIKQVIKENPDIPNLSVVLIGGTSSLNSINRVMEEQLHVDVVDYQLYTMGARDRSMLSTLGLIKYASMKPKVNEKETITTQVNRVNTKKNETYNFDEEL